MTADDVPVDVVFADQINPKQWRWYHVIGGICCLALMTAMWILQAELTQVRHHASYIR